MQNNSRLQSYIKVFIIVLTIACVVYAVPGRKTEARSIGPFPGFTGAPGELDCTACHNTFPLNSGPGSVRIFGSPVNYVPNQMVPISVQVSQESALTMGFQLTAITDFGPNAGKRAGTLILTDPVEMELMPNADDTRTYIYQLLPGTVPSPAHEKTWNFIWQAPPTRVGSVSFYATGNGGNGDQDPTGDYIYSTKARSGSAPADFDGDGRTDVSVWRPSSGVWYLQRSLLGFAAYAFGTSGDSVAPGDYDGDNKTDVAVFRPSNGFWYILQSSDGAFRAVPFGISTDHPVAADYDGDGKTDIAVFRASVGTWYYLQSTDGAFRAIPFGTSGDETVQQDYDGDGRTDVAVFRPSNGFWYYLRSSDGGFVYAQFGLGTDTPVAGDYDGDGKADLAVFRSGVWYLLRSSDSSVIAQQFGTSTDRPAPGNYDGDGKTDIAVFRPSDGNWYTLNSSNGAFQGQQFGTSGDVSVPSAYVP